MEALGESMKRILVRLRQGDPVYKAALESELNATSPLHSDAWTYLDMYKLVNYDTVQNAEPGSTARISRRGGKLIEVYSDPSRYRPGEGPADILNLMLEIARGSLRDNPEFAVFRE